MTVIAPVVFVVSALILTGCSSGTGTAEQQSETTSQIAAVSAVTVSGDPQNYSFSVTVESPDTGCDQYADWWEVLRTDGELVYRRILTHSHVNEQPFTRSGGPVAINADDGIYVRVHMNNTGYGSQVFSGSIEQGLVMDTLDSSFAAELALAAPVPGGCAF